MLYQHEINLSSLHKIQIEVVDARVLNIMYNGSIQEEKTSDLDIDTLDFDGLYSLEKNGEIKIPIKTGMVINKPFTTTYKISSIYKQRENVYTITCAKRTLSSIFLLPLVLNHRSEVNYDKYLINAYRFSQIRPEDYNTVCGRNLFLLFRFFAYEGYYNMEESLKRYSNFVDMFDPDKSCVAFEFNIPEEFDSDVELFINGKYSEMSRKAKERILKFHNYDETNKIVKILRKDTNLKNQLEMSLEEKLPPDIELLDKPNVEVETLKN